MASGSPLAGILIQEGTSTVTNGGNLSDHMKEHPQIYPSLMIGLVTTGEQAAKLPTVFQKLRQTLEFNARHQFEVLTSIAEPLIMVVVSIVVGVLIICTSLPLYGLISEVL
jgi:type II secretory pathway component PulF